MNRGPEAEAPPTVPAYLPRSALNGSKQLVGIISETRSQQYILAYPTNDRIVRYENYRSILSFIFAVDEINKDPNLLPNITLGYHIVDTCGDQLKTSQAVFSILSGRYNKAPNYCNVNHGEVPAFVVDSNTETMVPVLELYKYTQRDYRVESPFLQMILNWVEKSAQRDLEKLEAWAVKWQMKFNLDKLCHVRSVGNVSVVVRDRLGSTEAISQDWIQLFQTPGGGAAKSSMEIKGSSTISAAEERAKKALKRVQIIPSPTLNYGVGDYIQNNRDLYPTAFKLSPDYRTRYVDIVTFLEYIGWNWVGLITSGEEIDKMEARKLSKLMAEHEICVMDIIDLNHEEKSKKQISELYQEKNRFYQWNYKRQGENCTETFNISSRMFENKDTRSYYPYVSEYILAQALHTMTVMGNKSSLYNLREKLYKYVKHVHYTDPDGRDIHFDDSGNILHYWYIANLITYADMGCFEKPQSRCNGRCSPGYRKAPNGGYHACCYNCVPCSEGEVSNITDSESCHICLEEEWPDEKKEKCVPKTYEFLSYEKDIMVHVFSAHTLFFSAITLFTLRSFISYWDTPIVKANNRTVSFILLVSILLSFLCVFFFLGRPVDITCMMTQVSFGIFFSIGVSSVLAKTITVCIAFKATKPGSVWLKWVSPKISNSVVLVCSSVQVLICVIWLLVSPPYVEFDHHTYPGKIVNQCNEG
ncbi:vomeronasal type-2 receptor 26-like [Dendropsophus ebraccatus]|uniref:vomeronasal type-2 receptor 26-like n=1 Tax=Dendropsophus ebraccatus TaxID=150705 RepID=UPI003831E9CD